MTVEELQNSLIQGMNGHGLVLCIDNSSRLLGCRGDFLSGGYDGRPRNVRFSAKQCKKMLKNLQQEVGQR